MVVRKPLPTRDSLGAWFMDTNESAIPSAMGPAADFGIFGKSAATYCSSVANNGGQAQFNTPGHQFPNGTSIYIVSGTYSGTRTVSNAVAGVSFETGQSYSGDSPSQIIDNRTSTLPPAVSVSQTGVPFSYARDFTSTTQSHFCIVDPTYRVWLEKIDNAAFNSFTYDFWVSFSRAATPGTYETIFSTYRFDSVSQGWIKCSL